MKKINYGFQSFGESEMSLPNTEPQEEIGFLKDWKLLAR